MKIKSIKDFRWWFKALEKEIDYKDKTYEQDFMGTYHTKKNHKKKTKGFFELFHGYKPEGEAEYLKSLLKNAEDEQAIYEFLQNAVDCGSTHFYFFYNEKYFIAINNGEKFKDKELLSILNIAQSPKKDCSKIGRFGIGFKLVHRLVGENEGLDELFTQYKGATLFSWSNKKHLKQLINKEEVEPIKYKDNKHQYDDAPWLLKILITNFPAQPKEIVKDIDYQDREVFPESELHELSDFLKECFDNHKDGIDFNALNQGSLFFLKLGKGKQEHLKKNYNRLKEGVEYSMNMLKDLECVYLNEQKIKKQKLFLEKFEIDKKSEVFQQINPEYKSCHIQVAFGYSDLTNALKLKKAPNFYKYFPMGDETNGFAFILHSDSFSVESNRRKLEDTPINHKLFPEIVRQLCLRLTEYQTNNREKFLNIYASLLLSDSPNKDNNQWMYEPFWKNIEAYLKENIPTTDSVCHNPDNVKIKDTSLIIDFTTLGDKFKDIRWLTSFRSKKYAIYSDLCTAAQTKLNIKKWDVTHIIDEGDKDTLDKWISSLNQKDYKQFTKELNLKPLLRKITKEKLQDIKFIQFSDKGYYSPKEIGSNTKLIVNYGKTKGIINLLNKGGLEVSNIDFTEYDKLYNHILEFLPKDTDYFQRIKEHLLPPKLLSNEKISLFNHLVNEETKFDNVGKEKLKTLAIFNNNKNQICQMDELISPLLLDLPIWLSWRRIKKEEYRVSMHSYLIQKEEIYPKLLLTETHWNKITSSAEEHKEEFYKDIDYLYNLKADNSYLPSSFNKVLSYHSQGMAKESEIFINKNCYKNKKTLTELTSALYKITGRSIPHEKISSFIFDAKSPFYIDRKDDDVLDFPFQTTEITFSFDEIDALCDFCILNRELIFKRYILEKKDDKYYLKNNSASKTQYLSIPKIDELLINSGSFQTFPNEFKKPDLKSIGIEIEGSELYLSIIKKLGFNEKLIDIILVSENKVKKAFIDSLQHMQLSSTLKYDRTSFEHKTLSLLLDCYGEDSTNLEIFRKKIWVDNLPINQLTTNNNVNFTIDNKKYHLYLSDIITDYKGESDIITKLTENFEGIPDKKLNEKIFRVTTKSHQEILNELSTKHPTIDKPSQYAFLILYTKSYPRNIISNNFTLSGDSEERLNFFYKHKISFYDSFLHFTDFKSPRLTIYPPKYSLSTDDREKIPTWIINWLNNETEQKLKFLHEIGVQTDFSDPPSPVVEIRKYFKEDKSGSISDSAIDSMHNHSPDHTSNTLKWICENTNNIYDYDDIKLQWLQKIFNYQYVSDLPVCVYNGLSNKGSSFLLTYTNNNNFYVYDENIEESELIAVFNILESLTPKGKLIKKGFYNQNWIDSLKPQEISLLESHDIIELETNSKEWTDEAYERWQDSDSIPFKIFLFEGHIPMNKLFLNKVISKFNKEEEILNLGDSIYINSSIPNIIGYLENEGLLSSEQLLEYYKRLPHSEQPSVSVQDHRFLERLKEIGSEDEILELIEYGKHLKHSKTKTQDPEPQNDAPYVQVNNGALGEKLLNEYLCEKFGSSRVEWVGNVVDEYDFRVYKTTEKKEILYYIDAKSTTTAKYGAGNIPILLRKSEWNFMENYGGSQYYIARIFNINNATFDDIHFIKMEFKPKSNL